MSNLREKKLYAFKAALKSATIDIKKGILLVFNGKIIFVGDSSIEADKIAYEDKVNSYKKEGYTLEEYELLNNIIYPGLIDIHTHLGMYEQFYGFENLNENTKLINENIYACDSVRFLDTSIEDSAILGGVTTACVLPGSASLVGGFSSVIKLNGKKNILKKKEALKISLGSNILKEQSNLIRTSMQLYAMLDDFFLNNIEYRKEKIRCHLHRYEDIMFMIELKEKYDLDLCLEHATEAYLAIESLKGKNISINAGPFFVGRAKREMANYREDTVGILFRNELLNGIMTDYPSNPPNMLRNAMYETIKWGIPKEKALELITLAAAKSLNVADRIGDLAVGLDADFIIMDGDIFSYESKILSTYIDGEEVTWKNLH